MTHHSRYNYVVAIPESTDCLVYNFNTGALLQLNKAQKLLFDLSPQFSQDHPVVKRWRDLGFLSDRDELEDLKDQVRARYDGYGPDHDKTRHLHGGGATFERILGQPLCHQDQYGAQYPLKPACRQL